MSDPRPLAEIIAEGERQIANYQTMILPHGDARRLLAACRAGMEMRKERGNPCSDPDCPSSRCAVVRAWDAAAGGGEEEANGRR